VDWYLEEQALEGRELQREAVLEQAQADPTFLVEWLKREAAEA
jgi:hypothetical protein